MSNLLYQIRYEDINNSILLDSKNEQISEDFIYKIINDPKHADIMKARIYNSILEAVTQCPNDFLKDGEYCYKSNIYDHAYLVDSYVQAQYEHTQTKYVYQCMHCGSDRVQVKAWVRPNQGHAYVDEVEGDEMGWCDDCNLTAEIQIAELTRDAKVIGFQVIGEDGTAQDGEIHPDMDASFCIYNLSQARAMLDNDDNGNEQWRLLTLWEGDVEEPTMMFSGKPRD